MRLVSRKAEAPDGPGAKPRHTWKVLVVDDEPDIRALTRLSLCDFSFDGRELEFLEAASAYEAKALLARHNDIAMALIDVVMETEDAGLRLVEHIRGELGNAMIRLVIRTGQPGVAPERFVIDNFDIDDYKDKTELSATRLYTTVRSALKAYRDLRAIELNRLGLERVLGAVPSLYRSLNASLNLFFKGVLTQIIGLCNLDESSFIQTIDGLVATFDGDQATIQAATGDLPGTERFETIRQACAEMILHGKESAALRGNAVVVPLVVDARPVGFVYVEPKGKLSDSDRKLIQVMAQQCASALENLRLHFNLHEAYDSAIDMLAEVAEFKDKTTGDHINRIDYLTRVIALELGLPAEEAEIYGKASRLHDVGKIGIDDHLLRKPGRLTPEEFEVMKSHTQIGARILDHHESFTLAREVAYGHHERWDGKGYPEGRVAIALPLITRITSVVDVFDALINRRPYKEAWPVEQAVAEIEQGAGSAFDPTVVSAFLALYRRGALDDLIRSARDGKDLSPPAAA
jgi:response regulator RpfG family c-di-GMP phosphodiesterase